LPHCNLRPLNAGVVFLPRSPLEQYCLDLILGFETGVKVNPIAFKTFEGIMKLIIESF
jgi:hypothetical protein